MRASVVWFAALVLVAASLPAQTPAAAKPESTLVTIPAGSRLQAVLQHRFATHAAKPEDSVYLVTTFPMSVSGSVAIPAGTFIQAGFSGVTGNGGVVHGPRLRVQVTHLI